MADTKRVIGAFFKALRMTLRGETATVAVNDQVRGKYPALIAWCEGTVVRLAAVTAAADAAGWTAERRAAFVLHIEGRDLALHTALEAIRFHATREFPHLLTNDGEFGRLAVQGTTINDRYWAHTFAGADALPPTLRDALSALSDHLAALPGK